MARIANPRDRIANPRDRVANPRDRDDCKNSPMARRAEHNRKMAQKLIEIRESKTNRIGPDAIYVSKGVTGGAGLGGTASGGFLIVLRGDHKGMYGAGDFGAGGSAVSISTEVSVDFLYYEGPVSDITPDTFGGKREQYYGGVDIGLSLTKSYTISRFNGIDVKGSGISLGLGASATLLDIGANSGKTIIQWDGQ